MIIPEPKRTIAKGQADAHLDFREVLRSLKGADRETYQKAATAMKPEEWRAMLAVMEEQKPRLYRRMERLLKDAKEGKGNIERIRQASREIQDSYKCDEGLTETPRKRTVVVRLKHPDVITGLPKEIMHQSIVLAKEYGGKRKWTFGFDNRAFTVDLDPAAIEELRKNPAVEEVEEDEGATIMLGEIPTYNPAAINTDWGVTRMPVATPWGRTPPVLGAGVKVCVIDTGIGKNHQAFWKDGVCVYKGGWNFVGNNNNPEDDHDHGSYCCSIVAGQHSGVLGSYRGLAPGVDLYACKVLDSKGSGDFANVAAGIDWARENGMHIISMSLGGAAGTAALQAACDAAWYAGILVVAAAGNSGPGDDTVNYPGRYLSCIAVAAVDYNEYVASWSSRGAQVEIAAPGVAITGALMGFTYKDHAVPGSGERYMTAGGTSAACPHVAAAAALIKSWYPLATNTELRQLLRDHLRDL